MRKYLENPFVVLGALGIAYYVWNRKKLMAKLPKFEKSENPNTSVKDVKKDNSDIPASFKQEVEKMSANEISKTIKSNTEMLSRKKLGADERAGVKRMLEYLNDELKSKK